MLKFTKISGTMVDCVITDSRYTEARYNEGSLYID